MTGRHPIKTCSDGLEVNGCLCLVLKNKLEGAFDVPESCLPCSSLLLRGSLFLRRRGRLRQLDDDLVGLHEFQFFSRALLDRVRIVAKIFNLFSVCVCLLYTSPSPRDS